MMKQKNRDPHVMRFGGPGTEEHDRVRDAELAQAAALANAVERDTAALTFGDQMPRTAHDAPDSALPNATPTVSQATSFTSEDEWLLSVFAHHSATILSNSATYTELAKLRVCYVVYVAVHCLLSLLFSILSEPCCLLCLSQWNEKVLLSLAKAAFM